MRVEIDSTELTSYFPFGETEKMLSRVAREFHSGYQKTAPIQASVLKQLKMARYNVYILQAHSYTS